MKRFALAAAFITATLFAPFGAANAGVIQSQMGMNGDYEADRLLLNVLSFWWHIAP